jgi:hypothetical protein
MAVATEIPDLAVIELTHELDGHPTGAVGVVVASHPDEDSYVIEFLDSSGRAADVIYACADDLRVTALA